MLIAVRRGREYNCDFISYVLRMPWILIVSVYLDIISDESRRDKFAEVGSRPFKISLTSGIRRILSVDTIND